MINVDSRPHAIGLTTCAGSGDFEMLPLVGGRSGGVGRQYTVPEGPGVSRDGRVLVETEPLSAVMLLARP